MLNESHGAVALTCRYQTHLKYLPPLAFALPVIFFWPLEKHIIELNAVLL